MLKAAEASRVGGAANLFSFHLRATALFHSTPVLERKRRNHSYPRSNSKIPRRGSPWNWKHSFLRHFNIHADDYFEGGMPVFENEVPRNKGPSWFRGPGANGSTRQGNPNQGWRSRRATGFEFCSDEDIDVETMFRCALGGERVSFWSYYINEENARWRSSTGYSRGRRGGSRQWRFDSNDDDSGSSSDTNSSESASDSNRSVLGLSPSGPLKLEDIKHAYRTCALKYHPDRHQGPSKNAAEEKFKLCTVAYQSLCDKLTCVN